ELAALQLDRLRRQVDRLYRGSGFYREKLRAAGFEGGDLRSLEDLARLPVVTKEELREEQAAHPPFGRYTLAPPEDWAELHPSTGTTGVPVGTIWSARDVEHITDFTARTMWSFGVRPRDVVQNAFSYGLWVAGMSVHYAARRIGCFVIPIGAAMTERQIFYMQTAGSTVVLSTPSYALHIAERMRSEGVKPEELALRLGCFGGEPGAENPATRAKIEAGLGIEAYDYYGLGEIGPTMACECTAKAGLHWSEDHHVVEVVDSETRAPLAEGEVGVVVLTHLAREATPMLRYWTNDYARLDTSRCACGRTHARSPGGILGRADDLVIYRGAKFYPVQVEQVVRSLEGFADEFRIELSREEATGRELCVVLAECLPGLDARDEALAGRLRGALRSNLGVTPEVRLLPPGSLERTTFKAKRLVDLRPKAT
ncbi:MAG: phenylacetate--CoA ligase family protein, partial [Nitrospinota bacterium]